MLGWGYRSTGGLGSGLKMIRWCILGMTCFDKEARISACKKRGKLIAAPLLVEGEASVVKKGQPFFRCKGGQAEGVVVVFPAGTGALGANPIALFQDKLFMDAGAPGFFDDPASVSSFHDLELKYFFVS